MSDRIEKLERKEARRVLGERTTSIVGQVRERVTQLEQTFPQAVADLEQRVRGAEMAVSMRPTKAQFDDATAARRFAETTILNRVDNLIRDIGDLNAKIDLLAAATFRARLRWLFTGRWPAAPAERG